VGRYLMAVHVRSYATQIAVLEGRALIEHYVSRPADDVNQIDGNIYLGRVQNVLPGMEAAFVDIGTPKNAVLYRGDVRYDQEDVAVLVIRKEVNREYRGVVIDAPRLHEEVRKYVASISPALAGRVNYYIPADDPLPIFERYHVPEQLHKALDRKVWLPSGGSLIIERTEALTVIDVNTGKNVGSSSLEETVFRNNLEAAEEIARQLRLRDIGGIIVIDFIDM